MFPRDLQSYISYILQYILNANNVILSDCAILPMTMFYESYLDASPPHTYLCTQRPPQEDVQAHWKRDSTQKDITNAKNHTLTDRLTKSDNRGRGAPLIQLKLTSELIFCQEACSFHLNGCRVLQGNFSCRFVSGNVAKFVACVL